MKKGEHPEIDAYVKQLGDKRLYDLPSVEDARAYARMRLVQQRKPLPALPRTPTATTPTATTKRSREEIVAEAYVHTFCHRKRLTPKEPIVLDAPTRTLAYKLYVAGVLPVRLGGVNL